MKAGVIFKDGWRAVVKDDNNSVIWECCFSVSCRDDSAYRPAARKIAKGMLDLLTGNKNHYGSQFVITSTGEKISDYLQREALKLKGV